MKLFWKIFGSMFTIILVSYMLFSNILIEQSFQSAVNEVKNNALIEMQMYLYTLISTVNDASETDTINDSLVEGVAESIAENSRQSENQITIYDVEKKEIYSSGYEAIKTLDLKDLIIDRGKAISDVVWWIEQESAPDLEIVTAISFPLQEKLYFVRFERNLTAVYAQRSRFISLYRKILWIIFVVAGIIASVVSYRIARPIQLLSRATREYTGGSLGCRVKVKGTDEIADLTRDFNVMADRLQTNMDELQDHVRRQEEFTGAFAHELKTPLTSVIGYSEMLLLENLEKDEQREAAQYIYQEGKRLERLSKKMMELIQLDKLPQNMQDIKVQNLVAQAEKAVRFALNRKKIKLYIQAESAILIGDKDLLTSMLLNLLDNACKASDEYGVIEVLGYVKNNIYYITVRDNGKGIPEDAISKITDAFYMVDKSRARKRGGAGLGMAICKKISEVHHAEMIIDSKLGKGTSVTVGFTEWKKGENV